MSEFDRRKEERRAVRHDPERNSHIWTGAFILLIGVALLLRTTVDNFPGWIFSWKMLLVALGVFIGLRHGFKGIAWLILIIVGGVFLINDIYPELTFRRYMWPVALIIVGIFFILRPRGRRYRCNNSNNPDSKGFFTKVDFSIDSCEREQSTDDDYVDATSIFGGTTKNILSKKFKGGDIVSIFGGTELNLTQADLNGPAILEITTIFGGTKLIVPSNWSVKSEAACIFGGLEDKRQVSASIDAPEKVLVLRGTVIFGGIEIKSF